MAVRLNLLGEDITPTSIIKHVVEVHKYFRNHHAASRMGIKLQGM